MWLRHLCANYSLPSVCNLQPSMCMYFTAFYMYAINSLQSRFLYCSSNLFVRLWFYLTILSLFLISPSCGAFGRLCFVIVAFPGYLQLYFCRNMRLLCSYIACENKYSIASSALKRHNPVSILHKSIAGRYRPVRVADRPITARCRFI